MIHQTIALLFVLCLLAVFDLANAAEESKNATTTEKSGVSTFSALGALVATVLANLF